MDLAYWTENDKEYGVACLVVIDRENLQIVEEVSFHNEIRVPYLPGFLAFRELPLILEAVKLLILLSITPPPSYVINETKWGSSQINQHMLDGPQMSERWIRNRLDKLSMMEQVNINKAIKTGDVEFVISKVDTSGKVSTYYATSVTDSTGQVTQVKEGAIWP